MKSIAHWFGGASDAELKPLERSKSVPLPAVRTIIVDGQRRTIVRDDVYRNAFKLERSDRKP